jgi:hypothetical protein
MKRYRAGYIAILIVGISSVFACSSDVASPRVAKRTRVLLDCSGPPEQRIGTSSAVLNQVESCLCPWIGDYIDGIGYYQEYCLLEPQSSYMEGSLWDAIDNLEIASHYHNADANGERWCERVHDVLLAGNYDWMEFSDETHTLEGLTIMNSNIMYFNTIGAYLQTWVHEGFHLLGFDDSPGTGAEWFANYCLQ